MLTNKTITLRAMELEDVEKAGKWRFSSDNYDYFYEFTPVCMLKNKQWFENSINKTNEINFIIEERDTKNPVGMIAFVDIDLRNRKAEMGRVLIMERGKGYGGQAIELILDYGFKHLNLQKIYCEVFKDNENALKLYKKIGFEYEGTFKNHIFKNGEYKDVVRMAKFTLCQK